MVLALCFLISILMCAYGAGRLIRFGKEETKRELNEQDYVCLSKAETTFLIGFVCNLALSAYYVIIQFLEVLI